MWGFSDKCEWTHNDVGLSQKCEWTHRGGGGGGGGNDVGLSQKCEWTHSGVGAQREVLKTIVKTHCRQLKLSNKVDMLLFLDYILFLKRLASQADLKAEEQKEGTLQPVHIRAVKKNVLKSVRG
ncbi:hypothetical protein LSAT2_019200 [Lamellibrachia satsuma]|nr:hypothetical protein LSAT2_019200 [Lamellibrachia satsuma]